MPETRRELFTTTVLGALGVGAVAGAVVGYEAAETFLAPQTNPGGAGSVIAVQDAGDAKLWYFFHFESDRANCRLYSQANVPALTNLAAMDTATWFAVCKKMLITTSPFTVSYIKTDGSTGSIAVTLKSGHYLDDTSLANLVAILPPSAPQASGSWMEIGKQHN